MKKKFFDRFREHELDREDIHDYIEEWHNEPSSQSVFDYLGLTEKEYEIFIRYPEKVETLRKKMNKRAGSFLVALSTGKFIIRSKTSIPGREHWLWENKVVLASLLQGLADARAGILVTDPTTEADEWQNDLELE